MKLIFTVTLLFSFSISFSQWTRVQQLPATDITSLYHSGNSLYAGGRSVVYFSNNGGDNWDSTTRIPQLGLITSIIMHENELYVASYNSGVFKSIDRGTTWQNITVGIITAISDFCEWKGDLYASTLGASNFKLDPFTRSKWSSFSNGLSSLSVNVTSINGNSNALVSGTLANALYDYFPAAALHWEERFLQGQIHSGEGTSDIITAHDSLFLVSFTGQYYLSSNDGHDWDKVGTGASSNSVSVVNTNEGLLFARNNVVPDNHTTFSYVKKDSFDHPFVRFDFQADHYCYQLGVFGNRIWDASFKGLFFMSLSALPGITDPNEPVIVVPLDILSFDAQLNADKTVQLQWVIANNGTTDHFEIERSIDGITWNNIGNVNPHAVNEYFFTDTFPAAVNYYRIIETHTDGSADYTQIRKITINNEITFMVWPNPATNELHVQLPVTKNFIEIIDATGRIVFKNTIHSGSIVIPVNKFERGIYILRVKNDKEIHTERFLKE
ncbi:MAG: T9SS type A sorting domain-containing protein [Ferruginibacter sp.]